MIAESGIVLVAGSIETREELERELAPSGVRILSGSSTTELRELIATLSAAAHDREERAHMIVHNLKTPLTTLLATAEMLVDGDMGALMDRQRAAIQEIKDTGQQLLRLIEDLLDTWLLESPEHSLTLEEIDPALLVERLSSAWQPRFARGRHAVTLRIATPLPTLVADRALITRVLENVVENALTHGGEGIALEIGVTTEAGSGLGLAFCRLAVSAHGGSIGVLSKPGQGSTFVVRLPARPASGDRTP
jgi:signal transduction histidine kinase